MPAWKKVITSGSDASLNSLNVTSGVTGSLLGTASYATQALTASYATNGGVTQIIAGPNITVSPTTGVGQVTISSTGGGGGTGNTTTGSYGSFYSTQTQTNVASTARSMSLNTTDITNGVSISGSTNPYNTYIKTENAGVYDIQFSAQVDKTDSGTDEIWIWIRKNGTDISDSATSVQLQGNGAHYVAAWNFFVNAAANDYFQLMWYSPDANVRLHAEAGFGVVPGIPSLIVTANRVDQFLSNTGSFSGSFTGNLIGTASFATTASYVSSNFQYEIHVSQIDGNDTTGDGSLLKPVATVTKALTLLSTSRKTIIIHPGTYSENVTVADTNTTISTFELTGANTLLSGTLTIGTLGSGTRISGLKMSSLVISGTAQAYISNCTVDNQVTKSSSGYVEIINSELQCISGIQISGAGTTIINGNKNAGVSVSNASAQVIIKGCNSVVTPSASAGNLAIVDCIITALGGNGITITGASTTLTLLNSQVLVTAGNNVAPISVAGIYSIINTIYDKPGSSLTGISTNSIDYFQYIDADNVNTKGLSVTGSITVSGSVINNLTASYATQALSASYSQTASYLNTLNQDLTFNGNLTLNGTASIAFLNVTFESASVIYSSGSNQFGDATNDTQTLIGRTIVSGSLEVTGSANLPSITGSLFGTSSWAQNAQTASYVLQAVSASYAPDTTFPYSGSALITGSLGVTGSASILAFTSSAASIFTVRNNANTRDNFRILGNGQGRILANTFGTDIFSISYVTDTSTERDAFKFTNSVQNTMGRTWTFNAGYNGAFEGLIISNDLTGNDQGAFTIQLNNYCFGTSMLNNDTGTNERRVLRIANGVAPTTSKADEFKFYSADRNGIAGKASPHFRTEDGTVVWLGDESRLFNVTASRTIISSSQNTISGSSLTVYGSGSALPVFTVQGSQGELFSVTDSLSGSLFSVNDISGLPILEVFSDNTTLIGNYLDPMLITTAKTVQTNSGSFVLYSLPTASYDAAFFEYSVRSGSNARAGTIMAIQSGSAVNFTETTTTDFGNTSAVSFGVFITGSNMALTGSSTTGLWTTKCIVRGL